jgi:ATP-dependent Clp protease adapter protein ClpS
MVVRLNDDFNLMEFVIPVLEWIFDIDHETALRLMRQADHQGRVEYGIYPAPSLTPVQDLL